eukprot:19744-Heterococcus_DN1.PRE.1
MVHTAYFMCLLSLTTPYIAVRVSNYDCLTLQSITAHERELFKLASDNQYTLDFIAIDTSSSSSESAAADDSTAAASDAMAVVQAAAT